LHDALPLEGLLTLALALLTLMGAIVRRGFTQRRTVPH